MDDYMKSLLAELTPPIPGLKLSAEAPKSPHGEAGHEAARADEEDQEEITEQALDEAEENIEPEDERDDEDNLGRFYEKDYAERIAGWEFKTELIYVNERELEVFYRRGLGAPAGTKWERIGHARSPDALELRRLMRCAELRDERANDRHTRRTLIESMFGAGSVPLVEALIGRSEQPEPAPLTERQEAFCRHYLTEPSGTRAAILAGYSERSAENQAHRLMRNDEILQKISALRRAHALSYALDRDTMLDKLEAFFDDAMKGQSFSAALRALLAQAELGGLLTRRHKATQRAEARARAASSRRSKRAPKKSTSG